jgi:DNA-binding FadR family transcriptional regulator
MSMFLGDNTTGEGRAVRLCATITAEILSGRRTAGSPLREEALAADGGPSRTPVREAQIRLDALGLVLHKRNHGATVLPQPSFAEVLEAYALIDGRCAALAAERMAPAARAQLVAWLARPTAFPGFDVAAALLDGAANGQLALQSRLTLDRLLTTRRMLTGDASVLAAALVPDAAVAAAVAARHTAEAETKRSAQILANLPSP